MQEIGGAWQVKDKVSTRQAGVVHGVTYVLQVAGVLCRQVG